MRHIISLLSLIFLGMFTTACVGGSGGGDTVDRPSPPGKADDGNDPPEDPPTPSAPVCSPSDTPGIASCFARVATDPDGVVPYTATPKGYSPSDLQSAYAIDPTADPHATIAIVDAYDDPNAEKDLAAYRKQFGLPACTTANGCFRKVNQTGKASPLPAPDSGWAEEIALDLDMASAICPRCKILLVEAKATGLDDLGAAVDAAVKLGATVVSNSYGGPEGMALDAHYHHPGVQIVVAAGDDGYGVEYPASSPDVVAVGGTTLKRSNTVRKWTERAWGSAAKTDGGTGSGCSASEPKPAWQTDACPHRTVADVAAVADPSTGVAVYDSYGGQGWAVFGGTSAAAPIVAAALAVTGHGAENASLIYANKGAFHDVSTGQNGTCATASAYLCHAGKGYDGPTGMGSPNGAALVALAKGTVEVSTCEHDVCTTGPALTDSCDACAATICAADTACCESSWDAQCVAEAADTCGVC